MVASRAEFRIEQAGAEELRRLQIHLQHPFPRYAAFLGAVVESPRHLQSRAVCKELHGVNVVEVFRHPHKGDGVAARVTAEAIEHFLCGRDGKRRRFLAVERAQPEQVRPRPFERDVPPDQFLDVGSVDDLPYEIIGQSHGLSLPSVSPSRPSE